jgi:cytoskeletal protein CcmA (bactofilin family)
LLHYFKAPVTASARAEGAAKRLIMRGTDVSYFQSKGDRSTKPLTAAAPEPRAEVTVAPSKPVQDVVSTLGPGMLITGNVLCTGAAQIFGRIIGDIHASRLVICEGAHVEGKVVAQEAVIDGTFKGVVHGNSVKLQATAVVEGEIYNKSLTVEQSAQFEGVARRLDKAVEMPSASQVKAKAEASATSYAPAAAPASSYTPASAPAPSSSTADVVPLSSVLHSNHSTNGSGQDWTS